VLTVKQIFIKNSCFIEFLQPIHIWRQFYFDYIIRYTCAIFWQSVDPILSDVKLTSPLDECEI
jgi:hypothetical protein